MGPDMGSDTHNSTAKLASWLWVGAAMSWTMAPTMRMR